MNASPNWYPIPCLDNLQASQVPLAFAEKLAYLVYRAKQLPQVECPLTHFFEDGKYVRYIKIPKGTLFIGRPHRFAHRIELLQGSVIHVTQRCRRLITAPFSMVSSPGYQVAALALTDIEARTVHEDTGERDVEVLEHRLFGSMDELLSLGASIEQRLVEEERTDLPQRSVVCQL
jgi:hypothetical protein